MRSPCGGPTERHLHHCLRASEGLPVSKSPGASSVYFRGNAFEQELICGGGVKMIKLRGAHKGKCCERWHDAFNSKEATRALDAPGFAKPF